MLEDELELLEDELELLEDELELLEDASAPLDDELELVSPPPEVDEEELEDDDGSPEDDEELEPGVMPPSVQPCKANKPAVIKIKEIFFILTILTNCAQYISYAAYRAVEFRRFSGKSRLIIGYNFFMVRQVAGGNRKPDLVLCICGQGKHQAIHIAKKKGA